MPDFEQRRHREPFALERPRELVVVCVPTRSNVNLSRIVRAATCCGVTHLVACGNPRIDPEIARDGLADLELEVRRSPAPVLDRLRADGHRLVGLEQATNSVNIHEYRFERRTALVVGNERHGIDEDVLAKLDDVVEIPIWGRPYAHNVATATAMALFEYCRQWPTG